MATESRSDTCHVNGNIYFGQDHESSSCNTANVVDTKALHDGRRMRDLDSKFLIVKNDVLKAKLVQVTNNRIMRPIIWVEVVVCRRTHIFERSTAGTNGPTSTSACVYDGYM